jgi:hypothetical protein
MIVLIRDNFQNSRMFGNNFVKVFKFITILYSFYKIWVISELKQNCSIKFGRIVFRKNGNWKIIF